ncbi:hypothetical protein G6F22_017380 [Rhizopus arrhizus]|nr:hypothetical protein G6F22_017380 [Rhizopus arrhizus]KAG1182927.1 hypothetical protein G6F35_015480 [Rhizopus arrhizus]
MRGIQGIAAHERCQRKRRGFQAVADDALHRQAARIGDQRHRRAAVLQRVARAAARVHLADRHQFVGRQGHVAVARRAERHGQRRVLVAAQQVYLPLLQPHHQVLRLAGGQLHLRAFGQYLGRAVP